MTFPHRLLRLPAVIDRVGLHRATIYRKVESGEFPKPIHISQNAVGWIEAEIDAWIAARIAEARPEAA